MADVNRIKRDLERIEAKGDFRLQTQTVTMLISEVRQFVEQIAEEKHIGDQIHELERDSRKKAETPEEEKEIAEIRQALARAQKIHRKMDEKKAALRKLLGDTNALVSEIRKVV